MVSVIRRRKGNGHYYYLYHDSKGKERRQHERYLGTKIPPDIGERKRAFALEIRRREWVPILDAIRESYERTNRSIPRPIREKNLRAFAVTFTYNTQRIEGSALTLKDTALLLEDGITPSNRPTADVREAEAHQRVFLNAMGENEGMSLEQVTEWHKMLFAGTKSEIAGMIRDYDVGIGQSKFKPPPHASVGILVRQFFEWYEVGKTDVNPVELAALAHLKFVTIHPFGDGNGRISRLMMNHVLHWSGYPLLDIGYEDRRSYYNALERSQVSSDDMPFLQWFMKRYFKAHAGYW